MVGASVAWRVPSPRSPIVRSSVSALAWHPSSGSLASGAEDGSIHLWDVSALEEAAGAEGGEGAPRCKKSPVQTVRIEHCEVLCLATSADGTALLAGLDDGSFVVVGDRRGGG